LWAYQCKFNFLASFATLVIATQSYLDYYYTNRDQLYIAPSIKDPCVNTPYEWRGEWDEGWDDETNIADVTATYYALIEEIDHWVGRLLNKLKAAGLDSNTMIVYTSDHGELLGAHGLREKQKFYEEAVRVPMIISFPGQISPGLFINEHVSQQDIFATVLDYLGGAQFDESDGRSLRRYIEGTSYNNEYDEHTVISEFDNRLPKKSTSWSYWTNQELANFMVRKSNFKLIVPRQSVKKVIHMMYNLEDDPYETNNLLGWNYADEADVGKAEHLRILLLEWMERNDGLEGFYSDPKYCLYACLGDIAEIRGRKVWRQLDYWQSDSELPFGKRVLKDGEWVRNEYLYIGRTTAGVLSVTGITVNGQDAGYFQVDKTSGTIQQDKYLRIKVSFSSHTDVPIDSLDASIHFSTNIPGQANVIIPIVGDVTHLQI